MPIYDCRFKICEFMDVFTYNNLYRAYLDCRKTKRKTANALKFEIELENNLQLLLAELKNKEYKPGRSICFVVTKPVPREIFAADFRDRVVHHLLIREIIKYGERNFIFDSYACREDKGTHKAIAKLKKFIRQITNLSASSQSSPRDCDEAEDASLQNGSTAPIAIGDYGAVAGHPKSEIQNPAPVSGSGRGPKSEMDIYFIYWLACLVPIYNKDDIYNKFIKANSWIKNYLPNWQPTEASFRRDSGKGFADFYEDVIDLLIGGAEKTVKKIQLNKMPEKLKTAMNQDTRVVVNDNVLKLYANDRRKEYRKMWEKSLLDIKLKNWILQ